MGRNLIGCWGLLIAVGMACLPVYAGERKSARRVHAASEEISGARRFEALPVVSARTPNARTSTSADGGSSKDERTPTGGRKELTFFRINSPWGDVAVQPVAGQVNGAQFSVGF